MQWKKSSPDLIAAFEKAKPTDTSVRSRPMFGYPALFVDGTCSPARTGTGLSSALGTTARSRAKAAQTFEPMPGRPMQDYVVVPEAIAKSPAKVRAWIDHAHAYAQTLPTKKAR